MTARTKIESLDEFNKQTSKTYDSKTNYSFEDIEFTFEINLETANIISFKNCLFKEKVTLPSTIQEDASFAESIFEKEAIFANSTFENNVRFYSTKFYGTTDFNNTKFEYLADFWNAEFKHITIFYKTDFLGTTVFSSTKFNENVLFTYSLIEKLVIFRGTDFQKGIDLSLAIIPGKLTFFDIKFEIKNFKDVKDTEDVHEFGNNVSNTGVITRKNKRETFRIIKNQLNENQNSIDSLEFARYEKNAFTKQLEQSVYKDKNRKEIQNLILLYLNIISNKNGTS